MSYLSVICAGYDLAMIWLCSLRSLCMGGTTLWRFDLVVLWCVYQEQLCIPQVGEELLSYMRRFDLAVQCVLGATIPL